MSKEVEKIKKLLILKKKFQGKIINLESELAETQTLLELIDSKLLEKGFKRAKISKNRKNERELPSEKEQTPDSKPLSPETFLLQTGTGELLANLAVEEDFLRVSLAEDKNFSIKISPFSQFLIERVFMKMQEKDNELARIGKLPPDKIFSYNIVQENGIIREIIIKNFDVNRYKELKSSIRWTLEKMYEKMKKKDLSYML